MRVSRHQLDQAYDNFTRAFGEGSIRPFWKFIKINPDSYFPFWLNEEQEQRLNLLLGPHHYAIIKAYKIKHKKKRNLNDGSIKKEPKHGNKQK